MLIKLKSLVLSEKGNYLIVGCLVTLLDLICFSVFTKLFQWNVTVSNILAIAIAVLYAFFANKRYVFHSRTNGRKELAAEFVKFIGGRAVTMAMEVGGVFLACDVLHFAPMASKILIQFVVIVTNYCISRFFVFRKKH